MRALFPLVLFACAAGPKADTDTDTDLDTDSGGVDGLPTDSGDDTDPGVPTRCVTTSTLDSDADGTVDWSQTTVIEGAVRTVETDSDADGEPDLRLVMNFTDPGLGVLLSRVVTSLPDGTVKSRSDGEVDEQGRRTRLSIDANADGKPEEVQSWTYHPNGKVKTQTSTHDTDGDGDPEDTTVWTSDDQGRAVSFEQDQDGDEAYDRWDLWTYDGLVRENRAYLAPDKLQRADRWTALDAERDVKFESDNDGDGTFTSWQDEAWTYTWRSDGQPDEDRYDGQFGTAPDGVWDARIVRVYDPEGNLLKLWQEDPQGDVSWRQTWTYDPAGNTLSQEDDLDGDGTIQDGWVRTFDADGHVTSETNLQGGVITSKTTTTYTGDQIVLKVDDDGDGITDYGRTSTVDPWGRQLRAEEDTDGDGKTDSVSTSTFTCPPANPG